MTTAAEFAQLRKEAEQAGYTPQESALSWGQVFQSALSNTPSSATQFVDDMVTPFLSRRDCKRADITGQGAHTIGSTWRASR